MLSDRSLRVIIQISSMYESGHCFLTSQIFSGIHERQSPIHRKKNQTETICSILSSSPQLFDIENFTKNGRAVRQWFIGKCISFRPQRCSLLGASGGARGIPWNTNDLCSKKDRYTYISYYTKAGRLCFSLFF